jgi:hypothetical protein
MANKIKTNKKLGTYKTTKNSKKASKVIDASVASSAYNLHKDSFKKSTNK